MFTHILLPVDGSELAERALTYLEHIAPLTGSTIHLVEVVQLLPNPTWTLAPGIVPETEYEQAREEATGYLEATRARLLANGVRDVRATQLTGDPAASLLDYERDAGIDLVVMSSHGRTGLARFALGSVAERLVQYGSTPVLLVRAFGEVAIPRHVVVPLDGSARAEAALDAVERLAPQLLREVTLLRVVRNDEEGREAERYLQDVLARPWREGVTVRPRVVMGDPAAAIVAAGGPDKLVVMTTHGRAGFTRWALGSAADRVAHGGAGAVMLVRRGE